MNYNSPKRRVALAFFAHPDDAEILCAGTLIRLTDAGWEVHIVTVTAGDCGSNDLPARVISAIRRQEAQSAADQIGGRYHCLEEHDVSVCFDQSTNRKAIDLFRQVAPTLVFTHPRHDYMLDHEQVHMLARSASFAYPIPNASRIPLVAGSTIPWLYYCDPVEGCDPYSGERVAASVRIDISSVMERKVAMLASHASQSEWLRSHHGMDEYIEAMKLHNQLRGVEIGVPYAEGFVQHRGHAYPQTDLLRELFEGNQHGPTD
jgi:LmbE family N-acetylglucosaminyl deacetylase